MLEHKTKTVRKYYVCCGYDYVEIKTYIYERLKVLVSINM